MYMRPYHSPSHPKDLICLSRGLKLVNKGLLKNKLGHYLNRCVFSWHDVFVSFVNLLWN